MKEENLSPEQTLMLNASERISQLTNALATETDQISSTPDAEGSMEIDSNAVFLSQRESTTMDLRDIWQQSE